MKNHTRSGALLTEIILQIFRINGKLLISGDKLVKSFGQTSSRWQVLGALKSQDLTVPMIAKKIGVSRQSVQRIVDLLIKDALCQYNENPYHKRSLFVTLTTKGKNLLKAISSKQIPWVNKIATNFEYTQLIATINMLEKFDTVLHKI